jgi:ABC-type phosphate/phosphonate transport system substrate-binding protein
MQAELRQQIQESLIKLGDTQDGRIVLKAARLDGLNPANDSDYDSTRVIIKELPPQK